MEPIDLHRIAVEAMRTRGLQPDFPAYVLQQAAAARAVPFAPAGAQIRDLRALPWLSIDNDDTRDLDQLSVADPLPGGATRLLVAIADVDCRVARGSALDAHAAANTTSVYTAAGLFPMLPEIFSTDLTSLGDGQERLAVVVEMTVQDDGAITQYDVYRAAVINRARLAYDAVSAWLDGVGRLPTAAAPLPQVEAQLRTHDAVAARLRRVRQQRGALTVRTSSARPVFEGGRLIDLRAEEKNRAQDLIADLMIATNASTARYLVDRQFPALRRLLQAPRRWDRIQALAAGFDVRLPDAPDALALEGFLTGRRNADPQAFADLSLKVVKMLGSGEYAAVDAHIQGLPHFGLAVTDYTHSTAPNRRFPDLVTQRLLKAAIAGDAPPYSLQELTAIAQHCTLQEDNASKVERQVLKAAGAYLLASRIGERFDAIVTGAAPKGTFVRIEGPLLEGRLVRGFDGLDVGDTVPVRLVAVDAERSFIDFERA